MKEKIITIASIFISAISQNYSFAPDKAENRKYKNQINYISSCIEVSTGPSLSRLGNPLNSNNLYGYDISAYLSIKDIYGFLVFGNLILSYSQNDIFKDRVKDIFLYKESGIENTSLKFGIGVGKEVFRNFEIGTYIRSRIQKSKNKRPVYDINDDKVALLKFNYYELGMGLFLNFYFKSDIFLVSVLSSIGLRAYGRGEYRTLTGIPDPIEPIILYFRRIVKNNLGGFLNTKPCLMYFAGEGLYTGLSICLQSEFMGSENSIESIQDGVFVVIGSGAIFPKPLSQELKISFNWILCYSIH